MVSSSRRTFLLGSAAVAGLAFRSRLWAWSAGETPVAATVTGKVSGYREEGIRIFKSIPYGADTAKTRFQPPQPPEKCSSQRHEARGERCRPAICLRRLRAFRADRRIPESRADAHHLRTDGQSERGWAGLEGRPRMASCRTGRLTISRTAQPWCGSRCRGWRTIRAERSGSSHSGRTIIRRERRCRRRL